MLMRVVNPKKVEVDANKLVVELQALNLRRAELSIQINEKQSEYNDYGSKYVTNQYLDEYLENDPQLIQLRLQLENIEQQIKSLNIHHQRR